MIMQTLRKGRTLRRLAAAAAVALAAAGIAVAAQTADAATATIPDSSYRPPSSQRIVTNADRATVQWHGVAGRAAWSTAEGYDDSHEYSVPVPSGGAPFTYTDFLDVTYKNAGSIGGRQVDVKIHFDRLHVSAIHSGTSKYLGFYADTSRGFAKVGSQSEDAGIRSADKTCDVTVTVFYHDTGQTVPLPFYQSLTDIDVISSTGFKESWRPLAGFTGQFYTYRECVLEQSGGTWSPPDGYPESEGDAQFTETGLIAPTSNGSFKARFTAGKCSTSLRIFSQYVSSTAPGKSALNTAAAQAGEEVAWTVTKKMGTFYKDTMTAYTSMKMTDPLPEGVDYKSVKLTDGKGRDITASAGAASYNAASRTLTYTFASSWLANTGNYNGQTLTWRIATTAKNPSAGTVSAANRATVSVSGVVGTTPSATVKIARPALKAAKTASSARPQIGDEITYTVRVTQTNPDTSAREVQVADVLPAGLELVAAPKITGPAGCAVTASGNGWKATCPALSSTEALVVTYRARVAREAGCQQLANTVRANAKNASEAQATAKVYVPAGYIALEKSSSAAAVVSGYAWYTLAGARYGVYRTEADALAHRAAYEELVTDAAGKAQSGKLAEGRWYVAEIAPSRGYDADESIHAVDVSDGAKVAAASTEPAQLTQVDVANAWYDEDDRDGIRPPTIEATLKGDDGTERTAVISGDDGCSFALLPRFHDDGSEIAYTLESPAPEGYAGDVRGGVAQWVIENTHVPATCDVTVTKEWVDGGDADGTRPKAIGVVLVGSDGSVREAELTEAGGWTLSFEDLPKYSPKGKLITWDVYERCDEGYAHRVERVGDGYEFLITCERAPATRTVAIVTVWEDDDDRDGVRPDETPVRLTGDDGTEREVPHSAAGGWGSLAAGLPAMRDGGKEIRWAIDAGEVEGYETRVESSADGAVFTIIRSRAPETVSIPVSVSFDDDDDRDGLRPREVTVALLGSDGSRRKIVVGGRGEFAGLPANLGGAAVAYDLAASAPDGYTARIEGTAEEGFRVVLVHEPARRSLYVEKSWADNGNALGLRADAVFDLTGDDGSRREIVVAAGERRATAEGLYVYRDHGVPVSYSLEERPMAGYVPSIEPAQGGWLVVNTLAGTRAISIEKRWEGACDAPEAVWADVLADGKAVATVEIRAENGWRAEVDGLPAFDGTGREVSYTVRETREEMWEASYDGDADTGFVIVNRPVKLPSTGGEAVPDEEKPAAGSWAKTGLPIAPLLVPVALAAAGLALASRCRRDGGER